MVLEIHINKNIEKLVKEKDKRLLDEILAGIKEAHSESAKNRYRRMTGYDGEKLPEYEEFKKRQELLRG